MPAASSSPEKLSVNQQRVYEILTTSIKPLTAYEVIDHVGIDEAWAPPTVYRALKYLIRRGLVHRLESQKAFIACTRPHHAGTSVIFAVCENCGSTRELLDEDISTRLKRCADENDFRVAKTTLELRGLCLLCTA